MPTKTCARCDGTGIDPITSGSCPACGGSGQIEITGEWDMIQHKVDSIIAEQTALRQDLTSALTKIWNKVKDM